MKNKMKKMISVVVTCAMVLTLGLGSCFADNASGAAPAPAGFTDIKGHWAESIINEAAGLKIVGGYPDGTFRPNNLIKREEFFKLLTNILTTTPDTSKTTISFSDVVADEWYVPTIKIAVAGRLTSGYEDGTFGIGRMMSRQEAAKVAASVIDPGSIPAGAAGAAGVKDKGEIGDWAYSYVDTMFKKGYMKGDDKGNFRPTMALTRAEATTILLNIKKNEKVIAGSANEPVAAVSGCTVSHGTGNGVFTKGTGAESSPFEISSEAQFNHLKMHTSQAAFYVLTKDVKVTSDFATFVPQPADEQANWSEGNFEPIGTKESPFNGHLDGGRHTISALNIIGISGGSTGSDQKEKKGATYAGLFGCISENASVVSLTIDDSSINGGQYVGGFVGYNSGTVKNCVLGTAGKVSGTNTVGGVVGYSEKSLVSNVNKGMVTGTLVNTGGVAGSASANGTAAESCVNAGRVSGNERVGGVIGMASPLGSSMTVKNCSNTGDVNGGPYQAGGVIGLVDGTSERLTIQDCYNKGIVSGNGVNGGIAGYVRGSRAEITECYNAGTVTGSGSGGICGNNEGTIQYSYNKGNVVATGEGGGIVSYQETENAVITKCYNEGSVTAGNYAGGLVGTNGKKVNNSYNAGSVKGNGVNGGIAGQNKGTIENVYAAGNINEGSAAGGIAGRNMGTLRDSYWLDESCNAAAGMSEGTYKQDLIKKVTTYELSGQKKIKTLDGYQMLLDVMNADNATTAKPAPEDVWEYDYTILTPAPGGKTVISDGGGIVKPLESASNDDKGNTIDSSDLSDGYLYPRIIEK